MNLNLFCSHNIRKITLAIHLTLELDAELVALVKRTGRITTSHARKACRIVRFLNERVVRSTDIQSMREALKSLKCMAAVALPCRQLHGHCGNQGHHHNNFRHLSGHHGGVCRQAYFCRASNCTVYTSSIFLIFDRRKFRCDTSMFGRRQIFGS